MLIESKSIGKRTHSMKKVVITTTFQRLTWKSETKQQDDSLHESATKGLKTFVPYPRLERDAKGQDFEAGDENLGDFQVVCDGQPKREVHHSRWSRRNLTN